MADVQFISELMTIVIRNRINGFDQDDLDNIYAEYDDLTDQSMFVEDEFQQRFDTLKSYIRNLLLIDESTYQQQVKNNIDSLTNRLKIQSHFYTLWGYLSLEFNQLKPPDEFLRIYRQFLSDVSEYIKSDYEFVRNNNYVDVYIETVGEYSNNTRGASTDITPRTDRHKALVKAIQLIETKGHEGC